MADSKGVGPMRNIGMDRDTAQQKLDRLWSDYKRKSKAHEAAKSKNASVYNKETRAADLAKVEVLRQIRPIEESGVIPWIEEQLLSTLRPDEPLWCRRVLTREYDDDGNRSLVKAMVVDTPWYKLPLTKEQAAKLLSQLTYELERWDEE